MAIQTFTAAQVLTAAQMSALQANDYNQTVSTKTASYVLVAADKGTRVVMNVASSNTVTVNTSLFSAGDTLVIQNIGAGVTTVTAGTATVSSAGPLTIAQYGSGTLYFTSAGVSLWFPSAGPTASSGLTFISSGNIGTGTTFSLPTSSFTATYLNYQLMLNNVQIATGANNLMMRMRASGTDVTSGSYYNGMAQSDVNGSVTGVGSGSGGTSWRLSAGGANELQACNGIVHFFQPQTSGKTFFTGINWGNNGLSYAGAGALDVASAQDSMTLFWNNGANFGAGTYTLYGLANS
jgi:hypothetical protein